MRRGTVANHYVNQHQQRESHQFSSTDRLLDSSPASPSIYTGHHQCHLQHQQQDVRQQQRFMPSSSPRPRGSIVTATSAATGSSPAKYVLRTLSSTPPEFFDHHHQQHSNSGFGNEEPAAFLNTGSLQRNRLMSSTSDRSRRSSASPSLISSLISSFTNSHHHLRGDPSQPVNHGGNWSREFVDPGPSSASLEMMERRGGAGGNRVVTFDLPPPPSSSTTIGSGGCGSQSASKSSLLFWDRHQDPHASLRRYSLSGVSLMPVSSSTSCLISDSSIPAASVESNLQNHAAVIGSSSSHHHLARDHRAAAAAAANYATLRLAGRKATVTAFDNDPRQRNPYHFDHGRAFAEHDFPHLNRSNGKLLLDQHFVQRSGSFVLEEKRQVMMQGKQITNLDPANPILLSDSGRMMNPSPRCLVLPSRSSDASTIYGSSSKAPECSLNDSSANGLVMHAGLHDVDHEHEERHGQQKRAYTSPPACSSSSSGVVLDSTHNNGCHPLRHQLQQQPNRIKYSPDEGLGDERSEFEVATAGGGGGDDAAATSGNAITA